MRASILSLFLASGAWAATVSGQITSGGTGVADMEVRLWAQTAKGYSFTATNGRVVLTDASGNYTITGVPAGTYKLDTRMSSAVSGNYGDRWYDVAAPTGAGYVAQDADEIVLAAADTRGGIDVVVEVNGGFENKTLSGPAVPFGGLSVRVESVTDFRVHHNDVSKTTPASRLGEVSFRGLPPGSYRVHLHDPNYTRADTVAGPIAVTANTVATPADFTAPVAPADPNEPNNSASAGTSLDPAPLRQMPAQVISRSGSIGPRNSGDVDFFCWNALANERYFLRAVAPFGVLPDGGVRESPWVDPVVSFWRGTTRSAVDDDSGPLGLDARLDTGPVPAGPVCAAVTTYGDSAWNGMNQGSAGPYTLTITMGNRPPSVSTSSSGSPTPTPPTTLQVNEGATLLVDVAVSDPEQDPVTSTWTITNAINQPVSSGSLASNGGQITFLASNVAARRSPYTLTISSADAEFTTTKTVLIEVRQTNVPPAIPAMISPDAGSVVTTSRVTLVCRESADDDQDPLAYEFEVSWVDGGQLLQTSSVQGNDAGIDPDGGVFGLISSTTMSLPENARVQWRVRAFDGNVLNGYSPWSTAWPFVVDVVNEPPQRPVLVKPLDQETLMLLKPTLEARNPPDPEGDAVSIIYEIATDSSFTQVNALSPQVPVVDGTTTTVWTSSTPLAWGGQYFARATAIDARGARSQPGPPIAFTVRTNMPPMAPMPGAPFAMGLCSDQVFTTPPTSVAIPAINDVEQDVVIVQVQVARAADTMFAMPLFNADVMTTPMQTTSVSLESVTFEEDQRYLVRMRAKDGVNTTEWVQCSFTLDARTGSSADGGPVSITTKPGCHCASADWVGLVTAALFFATRRRR